MDGDGLVVARYDGVVVVDQAQFGHDPGRPDVVDVADADDAVQARSSKPNRRAAAAASVAYGEGIEVVVPPAAQGQAVGLHSCHGTHSGAETPPAADNGWADNVWADNVWADNGWADKRLGGIDLDGHTDVMKLAEALALRADAARRAEQLRSRITSSARYQEGESPAEDAAALLAEAGAVLDELESLIRRINRTNAATRIEGGTLTDALARRDILRLRHSMVSSAADAAAGDGHRGYRQLRSELKMIPALPVAGLRGQADDLARQLREVDTLIQRTNWEADLLD